MLRRWQSASVLGFGTKRPRAPPDLAVGLITSARSALPLRGHVAAAVRMSVQDTAAAGTAAVCPLALLHGDAPCSRSRSAMSSWA